MVRSISRDEIKSLLDRGAPVTLVEALPPSYYHEAHLPGALNLPHDQVAELAPSLLPDKHAAIIVYCANAPCQNSGIAARKLTALGYTDVRDYNEGKQDWMDAGLPTESGAVLATAEA